MKRRVLVTGGFGYLGGRIAVEIVKNPAWCVRLGTRQKAAPPGWLPDADVVVLDVLRPETFAKALEGVEAVIHLAALNEIESAADPQKAELVNAWGTLSLLEAAVQAGVKKFIYFSTAHVYGAPLAGHLSESSIPRPVHPYAITHHKAEQFVLQAHQRGVIQGIVIRLSNGVGAPTYRGVDRWTLLVNDLCLQAVRDKKLVLRSSGLQKRDFLPILDVCRATCHFLELPVDKLGDGIFNVGGDCSLSVWEMTQRIVKCCQEVLGFEPAVDRPEPSPTEKVLDLKYDIAKLKGTGFVLTGDMDEEIRQTLKMCLSMPRDGKP